ncbi:MAG TPA: hypothetical protein VK178_17810 [Opitutaceae bacterium]|nr:hypothetical protein [Opitutaceae bacterium]
MKHILPVPAVLLCATLFVSCKPASEQASDRPVGPAPAESVSDTVHDTAQALQEDASDAADEIQDFSYEQRANYVAAARAKIENLKTRLEKLSASVERSSEAVKADSRPRLAALRERIAKLEAQLDSAENTGADAWDHFKADMRNSYAEMKKSFREARQWTSEKIAP